MNDTKGILLWAGLLIICGIIFFLSRRMKKQIEENEIETNGVISRITDEGGLDSINLQYYARYRTENEEEVEGSPVQSKVRPGGRSAGPRQVSPEI